MSATLAFATGGMLPQASSFAASVDQSFDLVTWFAVFLGVLVTGGLSLLLVGPRAPAAVQRRRLMQYGALAALLLVVGFFVQGARVWADMQVVPRGAFPIAVALEDKGWSFTYPNGFVTGELHLPIDRPVRFLFKGSERAYSFAIPAFRMQVPVALREDRVAWVQPTLAGEFDLRTSIDPRAETSIQVQVHAEGGFDKWYQDISGPDLTLPPIELGQKSYQMRGCTQCHTVDGSKLVGPSFKGFATRIHKLTDGTTVEPTDEYIKESVLDPQAKVVEGFEPVMPSFRGRLQDIEIAGLAAYIKSLQ
ncbi:MAG: c-type cytochrome [Planctomycetes bacterium]|nr:c-type cytochrome [Planctomycetota bacterium]